MAIQVGDLVARIRADVRDFKRGMDEVRTESARVGREMRTLGRNLSLGLTLPLTAVAAASVKAAADMDSLRRAMTAVSGSAEIANREIERLKESAKLPGLGFREAIQGSVRLQAAGFSAEQARKQIEAFGNAIALAGGTKRDLDLVTLALTQIAASGRLLGQELRQLQQRVPQIQQALIEAFGTARTEELQEMGITAEQFADRITEVLGRLPRMTGGIRNAFENLEDSIFRARNAIGEALLPVVVPLLDRVSGLVEGLARTDAATRQWVVALGAAVAMLGPFLLLLGQLSVVATAISTALTVGMLPALAAAFGAAGLFVVGAAVLGRFTLGLLDARDAADELGGELDELGRKAEDMADPTGAFGALGRMLSSGLGGRPGVPDAPRIPRPAEPTLPFERSGENLTRLLDRVKELREQAAELKIDFALATTAEDAEKVADALTRTNDELRQAVRLVGQFGSAFFVDPERGVVTVRTQAGVPSGPLTPQLGGVPRVDRPGVGTEIASSLKIAFNEITGFLGQFLDPTRIFSQIAGDLLTPVISNFTRGFADTVRGLFSDQKSAIELQREALDRNTEAIRQNIDQLRQQVRGVPNIGNLVRAIDITIESFRRAQEESDEAFFIPLEESLGSLGLTMDDLKRTAEALGIEFVQSIEGLEQIRDLLATNIFGGAAGVLDLMRRRFDLLDITDPLTQFEQLRNVLAELAAGDLADEIRALSPENLTVFISDVLGRITGGSLEGLGQLTIDQFFSVLAELEGLGDRFDDLAESTDEVNRQLDRFGEQLLNVPRGISTAFARFRTSLGIDPTGIGGGLQQQANFLLDFFGTTEMAFLGTIEAASALNAEMRQLLADIQDALDVPIEIGDALVPGPGDLIVVDEHGNIVSGPGAGGAGGTGGGGRQGSNVGDVIRAAIKGAGARLIQLDRPGGPQDVFRPRSDLGESKVTVPLSGGEPTSIVVGNVTINAEPGESARELWKRLEQEIRRQARRSGTTVPA